MIKDSFYMSISTIVAIAFGVLTQHFLSKYLSQVDFGLYHYILSWVSLLSVFAFNDFNTIVAKSGSQGHSGFFRISNKLRFCLSLIGSLSVLFIGFFMRPDLINYFLIAAIAFPFFTSLNSVYTYLVSTNRFKLSAILNGTSSMLIACTMIIVALVFQNIWHCLIAIFWVTGLYYTCSTLYFHFKERGTVGDSKDSIKYGFQLSGISLFSQVASKIQYIILEAHAGVAVLALYFTAQLFPERIKGILKSFFVPLNMYLSGVDVNKASKFIRKAFLFLFILGLLICGITLLTLPFIIDLVFGDQYNESILFSLLLSINLIFLPFNLVFTKFLVYHSFKRIYLWVNIGISVLKILLYFLLVPQYQIQGIIVAVIASELLTSFIYLFFMFKNYQQTSTFDTFSFSKENSEKMTHGPFKSFNGANVIKVIASDEIVGLKIPFWVKLIGKLTFTRFRFN